MSQPEAPERVWGELYDFTSFRVQNIDMRPSFAFRFSLHSVLGNFPEILENIDAFASDAVASQAIAVLGGHRPKIAMSPLNVTRVTPGQCAASF